VSTFVNVIIYPQDNNYIIKKIGNTDILYFDVGAILLLPFFSFLFFNTLHDLALNEGIWA
jgi:hypothetical protein